MLGQTSDTGASAGRKIVWGSWSLARNVDLARLKHDVLQGTNIMVPYTSSIPHGLYIPQNCSQDAAGEARPHCLQGCIVGQCRVCGVSI